METLLLTTFWGSTCVFFLVVASKLAAKHLSACAASFHKVEGNVVANVALLPFFRDKRKCGIRRPPPADCSPQRAVQGSAGWRLGVGVGGRRGDNTC